MSEAPLNGGPSRPLFTLLPLTDFAVSWAGPHPLRPGFCFGSEDGRILFTDENGLQIGEPLKGIASGEAINGVARSGEWLAVSTRAEVTTGSLLPSTDLARGVVVFPHGAHGITTAPSGYFVAPLGRNGVMMLKPGSSPQDPVGLLVSAREGVSFYRALALQGRDGQDLLICAARQGGLGMTEVRWGKETYTMRLASFKGLDVVDVCAVGSDRDTPAVAALGRDGTLVLVRNALRDDKPLTVRFNTIQGTAYRLLSAAGHLFLLTSSGLYGLMQLGERLLTGFPPGEFTTQIAVTPVDGVDANLAGERWLLLITPDEVLKLDIDLLAQDAPGGLDGCSVKIQEARVVRLTPDWQVDGIPQRSTQMALTA